MLLKFLCVVAVEDFISTCIVHTPLELLRCPSKIMVLLCMTHTLFLLKYTLQSLSQNCPIERRDADLKYGSTYPSILFFTLVGKYRVVVCVDDVIYPSSCCTWTEFFVCVR